MKTAETKKIESYQDLKVWQKSMDLVAECYRVARRLPPDEQYGLGVQMKRAAVSIPANIAEGFGRWHPKEFVHFLLVANGSLKELETHLLIGKRLGLFRSQDVTAALALGGEVGRMIARLRQKLTGRGAEAPSS